MAQDQYKKCQDCRYYEILQEPETGTLIGHQCVIYPDCIYKGIYRDDKNAY